MKQFFLRNVKVLFGLLLFGFASYMGIQADIGYAPWIAFSMGLHMTTGISYGTGVILTGLVILAFVVACKERIGIGTILNVILVGKFVDLFLWLDPIPMSANFGMGVVILVIGQIIMALATYFYISPGLGAGPRDSLMVLLARLLPKIPIGFIRGIIETTVLIIGWLLGSKVGFGTIIAVVSLSLALQYTFKLFHFDVKLVRHEDILTSFRSLRGAVSPPEPPEVPAEAEKPGCPEPCE